MIVQDPRAISFAAEGVYEYQDDHQAAVEAAAGVLRAIPWCRGAARGPRLGPLGDGKEAYRERTSGSDDEGGVARTLGRIVGVLILVALIVGVLAVVRRATRGRRERLGLAAGFAASSRSWGRRGPSMPDAVDPHEALDGPLDDLARRITELAPDVDHPGSPEAARRADAEAVLAFGEARDALPGATTSRRARKVHKDITRGLEAAERPQAPLDGGRPGENR